MDIFVIFPVIISLVIFIIWINIIIGVIKKVKNLKNVFEAPIKLQVKKLENYDRINLPKKELQKSTYKKKYKLRRKKNNVIKFCPRCGAETSDFSKKCSSCNYRLYDDVNYLMEEAK